MSEVREPSRNWLSLATAARELATTPLNVLMYVKNGQLVGAEGPEGWLIDAASVVNLEQRRASGDVPPVCRSACTMAGKCGSCA